MAINFIKKIQIKVQSRAQVKALLFDEASMVFLTEYFDYSDIFLAENVAKLPEYTNINEYAIKLKKDKQPYFKPIYSLELV